MLRSQSTKSVAHGHDRAARRLFGHPEVVADLLRGFAPQGPIRDFRPDSLRPLPDDRVDAALRRRQSDGTWTFALPRGEKLVLILEAQSTNDRTMPARMAVQVAMHCEGHLRSASAKPLPGVLPMVFYTGRDPWRARRSLVEDSNADVASLLNYYAPLSYFLVDAWNVPEEALPQNNRVSLMIRMMRAEGGEELVEVLRSERAWLATEDIGLWRDFVNWAAEVLAPIEFPDMDVEQLQSLQEGIDMINEGVVRELEESRQQGLAEGIAEGMAEGMAKGLAGQRSLLQRQIVWKFGDATAARCANELSGLSDKDQMEELGKLIIDCRTGEEFLAKL